MIVKVWVSPKFTSSEIKKIIKILNKNLRQDIKSKFVHEKNKNSAYIKIYLTPNQEIIDTHDISFDGLSSGQYMGNFPRVVHINQSNWLYPPECWKSEKNGCKKYKEYVILHEVIHTLGLDHPSSLDMLRYNRNKKCPVIYPQTKCYKLSECKANHRMDSYTRKRVKNMWKSSTKRLLSKIIQEQKQNQMANQL